jgi:hypothetical protein
VNRLDLSYFRAAKIAFWILVITVPVIAAQLYTLNEHALHSSAADNTSQAIVVAAIVTGSIAFTASLMLWPFMALRWSQYRSNTTVHVWPNTIWSVIQDGRCGRTYLGPQHVLSGFLPGWGRRRERTFTHITM